MAHPENDRVPSLYASQHASTLTARWNAQVGQYVRQFAPYVFPGAPPEAFIGFTLIGGQTEDTGSYNPFHEIGYFQTEAGPGSGPSPNPDPNSGNNNWARLANDSRVTSLLGRSAVMGNNQWQQAVADQSAVGLVNLADAATRVASGIPENIRPSYAGSLWNTALGFTGFSAGVGGAQHSISRYASQLANVPEESRFAAWVSAVLRDAQAGTLPGPSGNHGNPAYDILRTWQKLAAGQLLAQQTGGANPGWFNSGFGQNEAAAQQALTDAAYRRGVSEVPSFTMAGGSIGTVIALLAVVGGGYVLYRAFQPKRRSSKSATHTRGVYR